MPVRATKRGADRTPLRCDCDVLVCGASFAGLAGPLPFPITLDHWRLWIAQNPDFDWHTLGSDAFEDAEGILPKRFRQRRARPRSGPIAEARKTHRGEPLDMGRQNDGADRH